MTTKSDDKVAQATPTSNEKTNQQEQQEDEVSQDEALRIMAESLEKSLRQEIDIHPEMDAGETFESVAGFLEVVAGALHMALDSFENIISDKDPAYPKGLLTPIFLKAFVEHGGAHCQVVRLPNELVDSLIGPMPPEPKDVLH